MNHQLMRTFIKLIISQRKKTICMCSVLRCVTENVFDILDVNKNMLDMITNIK